MAEKSIFSPGGDGMTHGGLDGYLGSPAQDFSNLPEQSPTAESASDTPVTDCEGADKDQAVCQIAKAEKERGNIP